MPKKCLSLTLVLIVLALLAAPIATPAVSPQETAWAKVVEAAKKEGKVNGYIYSWGAT